MESPDDHTIYIELLVPDARGALHLFVEPAVLAELEPDSCTLIFVMDISRRHELRLDRSAGELVEAMLAP